MNTDRRRTILSRLKSYHPAVPDTPPVEHTAISYEFIPRDDDSLAVQLSVDTDTLALLTYTKIEAYNPVLEERIASYNNLIPTELTTPTESNITIKLDERPLHYYYDVSITPELIENTQLYVHPKDWTGVFRNESEIAEIHSWYNHIYNNSPIEITTSTRCNRD